MKSRFVAVGLVPLLALRLGAAETSVKRVTDIPQTLCPSPAFELRATEKNSSWPGWIARSVAGAVDLSAVGEIRVEVSNRLARPLTVNLSVKSRGLARSSPGGSVTLPPQASGFIDCDLHPEPWRLDTPLEFVGMNGFPHALGGGAPFFDVRAVAGFHLFLKKGESLDAFDVVRIEATRRASKQVAVHSAKTFLPFVDRYGQFRHADWPGKIHDDAELVSAREAEAAWLTAHADGPCPDVNKWGGWTKGPQLKATGFFRTAKVKGAWWLVDPDGRLFWSHGVDCVWSGGGHTPISYRERYFADLPEKDDAEFGIFWKTHTKKGDHGFYAQTNHVPFSAYGFASTNAKRKYGADWQDVLGELAHRRMRAWGLNTMGNWTDWKIYGKRRTPYTLWLETYGTPRRAGTKGWWGPLPDPDNPEFARILRGRVRFAAKSVKDDPWCLGVFVDNELSWNDDPSMGPLAESYYRTVARILKEELPNHLYLGNRIAWGSDDVYRAAARHCDVVSVNVYTRTFNRDLPADAVDKPMLVGEFHFGALDRGMFHTGLVSARNQADRARRYRAYVESCLAHPRVVGAHWFQWNDEPLTGRALDGENYQIGLLSVADTPYPEMVDALQDVARRMYPCRFRGDVK